MDNIIEVENVSMRFRLEQNKTDTIKEYLLKMARRQLRYSDFYALNDVSFRVGRGDSVALIGTNGSGKSTMLKLIAGVMYPTGGSLSVRGSIAPLIELGAGFDMDLTARENIFLNGAILGHNRAFMQAHFDEIVDFAELRAFIDAPIKTFSSGMIARLGFSIATQVRADILVVDEILAVGDYLFQQKCYRRMEEMLSNGTTLLFVSHDANQVRRMCKKAVWLDNGVMRAYGEAESVCAQYQRMLDEKNDRRNGASDAGRDQEGAGRE